MSRNCYLKSAFVIMSIFMAFLFPAAPALADDAELLLYCGAGLRQPVDELIQDFQKQTGWKVSIEFGGSGQLLARYKATGAGDVFLPGSHFYVDKLEGSGDVAFRKPVALHTPVVAVNKEKSNLVKTFDDLAKPGVRVGLGDPQAMALGRTAEQILDNSGLKDVILPNVVARAGTVKQLTLYVSKGDVDAAIIARADAFQNTESLKYFEINPQWYTAEIITAAVLKSSGNPQAARKLADYLSSERAVEVFGKYGFLPAR